MHRQCDAERSASVARGEHASKARAHCTARPLHAVGCTFTIRAPVLIARASRYRCRLSPREFACAGEFPLLPKS